MTQDEEILELKAALRESRDKLEKKINTELIKALKIESGNTYLIFFGKDSGLSPYDIAKIDIPEIKGTMFILNEANKVQLVNALEKSLNEHAWDEGVKKTFLKSFDYYLDQELKNL